MRVAPLAEQLVKRGSHPQRQWNTARIGHVRFSTIRWCFREPAAIAREKTEGCAEQLGRHSMPTARKSGARLRARLNGLMPPTRSIPDQPPPALGVGRLPARCPPEQLYVGVVQ